MYLTFSLFSLSLFAISAQPASSECASHFCNIRRGRHHVGWTSQDDTAWRTEGISCRVLGCLSWWRCVECVCHLTWTLVTAQSWVWTSLCPFVSQNGAKCKTSQPPRSRLNSEAWRSSPTTASRCWPTPRLETGSVAMSCISKPVKTVSPNFSRSLHKDKPNNDLTYNNI